MNKLEARKVQMLVSQRKKLEEELLALENEILNAVRMHFESIPCYTDENHRRGNLSRKAANKTILDRDCKSNLTGGSQMSMGRVLRRSAYTLPS